jgi:DNA polymerase-3 subunit epsilon
MDSDRLEGLARELEGTGDYRVLRRFQPRERYAEEDGSAKVWGAVVDVETSGFDCRSDAIIQFAMVPFEFGKDTGRIYRVGEALSWFEDPGRPIPADITRLTGITDDDVRGQRIDDAAVEAALADVKLVIAHNAAFDRPFIDRRLAPFRSQYWGCSQVEVPWKSAWHYPSAALESLMLHPAGMFFGAHRAPDDCLAVVHLLAAVEHDGQSAMSHLLHSARQKSHRIWALDAPIDRKDILKARKYRWNPGNDGRPKAWHTVVPASDKNSELEWLRQNMYDGAPGAPWRVDDFNGRNRYAEGW